MTSEIQHLEHSARIKDVELIWARNSKEFLFANSLLIHGIKPVIVDPSANFTYIEAWAATRSIHMVLNTHYHADHRALNQLFKKAVFASHEADADAISDINHYLKEFVGEPDSMYANWIRDIFKKYKIVDCPVTVKFKDGDVIDTGGELIEIVGLPGHTPGHIGLYFHNADLFFLSDIDLTPHGPWYANKVSSIEDFKASLKKARARECKYYVTSHGERIYDRDTFLKKLERFEAAFEKREQKILEMLSEKPKDLAELCSQGIVYKTSALKDNLRCYFQLKMVEKHLVALLNDKKIIEENGVYSVIK